MLLIIRIHVVACMLFVFKETDPSEIDTLSLHDALPISLKVSTRRPEMTISSPVCGFRPLRGRGDRHLDRKSTRLNSSHANTSYSVVCFEKQRFCRDNLSLRIALVLLSMIPRRAGEAFGG